MISIIRVLNHERISWVSIEIYYHENFVFGHIFMFLTSMFGHFCVLCAQLVGVHIWRGLGGNDGKFLGIDLWSISPSYTTFRFDTCMEHLDICRMHF